jgi:heavy metal translocating P-type ATPase
MCGFLRGGAAASTDAGGCAGLHAWHVRNLLLPVGVSLALLSGLVLRFAGYGEATHALWVATLVVVIAPLAYSVARRMIGGQLGADVIALLAIAGALALSQYEAGLVIALMLSGGELLDERAFRRARRELAALAARAPAVAHRHVDGRLVDVPAGEVTAGDALCVLAGEIVPVDCRLMSARAVLDEAALTGESLPVLRTAGEEVRSGASVVGEAIDVSALRSAATSTYARIVQLVERAEADRPRTARIADRAAVVFLPVTLAVAGLGWLLSGSPVAALAVLVVATPCPLILATPIAFVSGLARAARRGIVLKGGTPLERLGLASIVVFDKTGTLTTGRPEVIDSSDELLALAAAVEEHSTHPLAAAIRAEAHRRELVLPVASAFHESFGDGAEGDVSGRHVRVGRAAFAGADPTLPHSPGVAQVWVALDGAIAGVIRCSDPLRADAAGVVDRVRAVGATPLLLTGDASGVAEQVARATGIDDVHAEATPEDKATVIGELRRSGEVVVMVGDGLNDAPALAAADVGVALGANGSTISSDAADAVVLVDDLGRVADAIEIGRQTLAVARTGIFAGMGLSAALMVVAASGGITPLQGAVAQEVIDVAAILNGLRALGDHGGGRWEARFRESLLGRTPGRLRPRT